MHRLILNLLFTTSFFTSIFGQNNILINEVVSSNINVFVDTEYGEYSDWIELYNPSDSPIDISGFYLTDDISSSAYWQIPPDFVMDPNSYLIIWADDKNSNLHTNFKLSSKGEQIFLLSQNFSVIDSVTFGNLEPDVSYGRNPLNFKEWLYFGFPTPAKQNSTLGIQNAKRTKVPKINYSSGFYASERYLIVIPVEKNTKIYYSTDGSHPHPASSEFTEVIELSSSTVVKIIAIEEDKLPSEVIVKSYFINNSTKLPVMSIVSDPKNFWDDEIGIYTLGTNGNEFWGVNANYWQDWERPVYIEFFDDDKSLEFELNAGIAINGARRNMLQKSLRIFSRNKYGKEKLNYKLFPSKEVREYSSFILRNGGYPDYYHTLYRDGFIQSLVPEEMNLDLQAYRPCILYINGQYWGIYNIREKQNEEYLNSNRGVDPNNLDILENNMKVVEGDEQHYKSMITFIENHDLSVPEYYDSVKKWMDIDNYINYQIIQQYVGNIDWPANNIKYWRSKTPGSKWKWMLFDVDAGFGGWSDFDHNSIEFASADNSPNLNNAPWSTFLFRNLLKNKEFGNEFAQRFASNLGYSFNPDKVEKLLTSIKNRLSPEIGNHISRWSPGCSRSNPESKDGCVFSTVGSWNNNYEISREFAFKRPEYLMEYLQQYFNITEKIDFLVTTNDALGGYVFVNGVNSQYSRKIKLFSNNNIRIDAQPSAGYHFVGWRGDSLSSQPTLVLNSTNSISLEAVFEPNGYTIIPEIIDENLELNVENSPYSPTGNIYIYEYSTLNIQPGVEIIMPESANIFVFGSLNCVGTTDEKIAIKSLSSNKLWGAINIVNSTSKSRIFHTKITGTTSGEDELTQIGGISSYNSDLELNYILMDSVKFPIFIQYGSFIMRNSIIHTDVTSDLVNVKYGSAIIENCEFIGGNSVDTDAIDYDDVTLGIIRRNTIHDFHGDNSDGIDIGEGAKEVLIEENLIYSCSDKGISIGQESSAIIRGNIISDCNLGIGIKDDLSFGRIDHNTFYSNNIAVSCFEKTPGRGGGKASITNSIFSNSSVSDILSDEFSEIIVTYSLSDKELLEGEGNLYGNPNFIDIDSMDFRVSNNSIALDNGDPEYTLDPDGSRTDIGASYFDFTNDNEIVITEINYHSHSEFDTKDWIEFFNPNNHTINLNNWIFKDSNDDNKFVFNEKSIIESNSYLVLCEDTSQVKLYFPEINNLIGNFDFGLSNGGENIRIFDDYGNLVDSLSFDDNLPWPESADGEGFTLQLIDYEQDNSSAENWTTGPLFGTPGMKNIILEDNRNKIPDNYLLSQNYPNPFNSMTIISYSLPKSTKVILKVYDILGREVTKLVDEFQIPGTYEYDFFHSEYKLSSGIYFYTLFAGEYQKTLKMLILK